MNIFPHPGEPAAPINQNPSFEQQMQQQLRQHILQHQQQQIQQGQMMLQQQQQQQIQLQQQQQQQGAGPNMPQQQYAQQGAPGAPGQYQRQQQAPPPPQQAQYNQNAPPPDPVLFQNQQNMNQGQQQPQQPNFRQQGPPAPPPPPQLPQGPPMQYGNQGPINRQTPPAARYHPFPPQQQQQGFPGPQPPYQQPPPQMQRPGMPQPMYPPRQVQQGNNPYQQMGPPQGQMMNALPPPMGPQGMPPRLAQHQWAPANPQAMGYRNMGPPPGLGYANAPYGQQRPNPMGGPGPSGYNPGPQQNMGYQGPPPPQQNFPGAPPPQQQAPRNPNRMGPPPIPVLWLQEMGEPVNPEHVHMDHEVQHTLLILHADECPPNGCNLLHCEAMKELLRHVPTCDRGMHCNIHFCWLTKETIDHVRYCEGNTCPLKTLRDGNGDHPLFRDMPPKGDKFFCEGPPRPDVDAANPPEQQPDQFVDPLADIFPADLEAVIGDDEAAEDEGQFVDENDVRIGRGPINDIHPGDLVIPAAPLDAQDPPDENVVPPAAPPSPAPEPQADPAPAVVPAKAEFPSPLRPDVEKEWHKDHDPMARYCVLRRLFAAFLPTNDPDSLKDKRVWQIYSYARSIELEKFKAGENWNEYCISVRRRIMQIEDRKTTLQTKVKTVRRKNAKRAARQQLEENQEPQPSTSTAV